jgi:hypothetical protein
VHIAGCCFMNSSSTPLCSNTLSLIASLYMNIKKSTTNKYLIRYIHCSSGATSTIRPQKITHATKRVLHEHRACTCIKLSKYRNITYWSTDADKSENISFTELIKIFGMNAIFMIPEAWCLIFVIYCVKYIECISLYFKFHKYKW